jgi:cell division septation protein DedD
VNRSVLRDFGACDSRFSDEQILAVLRDAEGGTQPLAELCAAHGITIPMFCVWKAKYRGLTPDALRARRRRADWRARALLAGMVLAVTAMVSAGGTLLAVVAGWAPHANRDVVQAVMPDAPQTKSAGAGATATKTLPAPPEPMPTAGEVRGALQEIAAGSEADTIPTVTAPSLPTPPPLAGAGSAVQVAAAPTLAHAQEMVETLTEAGHAAYVVPVTVDNVEYFRVRVGPFDSPDAAEEGAGELKRSGYPGAWVVR